MMMDTEDPPIAQSPRRAFTQHRLNAELPLMSEDAFIALRESMRELGQLVEAIAFHDQIVDGWGRKLVCDELGTVLDVIDLPADTSPQTLIALVSALNMHRKHLSASQRAAAAAMLAILKDQAVLNEVPGAGASHEACDSSDTIERMAHRANVSERTMSDSVHAMTGGSQALRSAMLQGEISVNVAARIARLPPDQQDAELQQEITSGQSRGQRKSESAKEMHALNRIVRDGSSEDDELAASARDKLCLRLTKACLKAVPALQSTAHLPDSDALTSLRDACAHLLGALGVDLSA